MVDTIPLPADLREEAVKFAREEPSYDMVIPGNIYHIPKRLLTLQAKFCYGVIRSLAKRKGYCWANNPYLANIMGCTTRAIPKWLAMMVALDLVVVEHFMDGKQYHRRIWLKETFKIKSRYEQPFMGGMNSGSSILENKDSLPKGRDKNSKKISEASEEGRQLSDEMKEHVLQMNPDFSEETSAWPKVMDEILQKKNGAHLKKLIKWIYEHNFWSYVIISPKSLKRNLSKIEAQFHKAKIEKCLKNDPIARHKGLCLDDTPRDPRKTFDFSNEVLP